MTDQPHPHEGIMTDIDDMLRTGDRKAWREFLRDCTMQEACLAHIRASRVKGLDDMQTLAFKRMEHLNG